jgi:WD40 repeat protein
MNRSVLVGAAFVVMLAGIIQVPAIAAEVPAGDEETGATDLYGDPLPEGAVLRLGTVRMRHTHHIRRAVFSPDGTLLASMARHDRGVSFWDVKTGAPAGYLPVFHDRLEVARMSSDAGVLAFSPDGTKLVFGDVSGSVGVWDLARAWLAPRPTANCENCWDLAVCA